MQADVAVDALREAAVDGLCAGIEPVEGGRGAGVRLAGGEVGVEFAFAQVAGEGAPAGDHAHGYRGAVVLGLDVAEAESHGFEVVGEDVGDAVLGADDLHAIGEVSGGGLACE